MQVGKLFGSLGGHWVSHRFPIGRPGVPHGLDLLVWCQFGMFLLVLGSALGDPLDPNWEAWGTTRAGFGCIGIAFGWMGAAFGCIGAAFGCIWAA